MAACVYFREHAAQASENPLHLLALRALLLTQSVSQSTQVLRQRREEWKLMRHFLANGPGLNQAAALHQVQIHLPFRTRFLRRTNGTVDRLGQIGVIDK